MNKYVKNDQLGMKIGLCFELKHLKIDMWSTQSVDCECYVKDCFARIVLNIEKAF